MLMQLTAAWRSLLSPRYVTDEESTWKTPDEIGNLIPFESEPSFVVYLSEPLSPPALTSRGGVS
jgi:hypothetical protein